MSHPLDETGKRVLDALGGGLPLSLRPYSDFGASLGMTEAETIAALRRLREARAVRRLGAMFSPARLGYHAALGALDVPESRVESTAELIAAMPSVTHVFEMDDHYRLWFVLVVPSPARLSITESEIAEAAGAADRFRVLSRELFKVTASFDAEGCPDVLEGRDDEVSPVTLGRDEKALVRLLQGDIGIVERPFAELASTLEQCGYDVDERWVLHEITDLQSAGAIRHIGCGGERRDEPWRAALAVWPCPEDVGASGQVVASFPEVIHCFERRVRGAGRAIVALVEAEDRAALEVALKRISAAADLDLPRMSYPVQEYKRAAMKYFTEGE